MEDGPDTTAAGPPGAAELDRRARRRLLVRMAVRLTVTSVGLLVAYLLLPIEDLVDAHPTVLLLGGLILFVAVLAYQVRAIVGAEYPRLRAVEALGVAIPLVVVVFATVYASLGERDAAAFTQPLDKASAVYFTVTVLSTTGFGDIAAVSGPARAAVTVQMLIDLVLIGVVVRLLATAAHRGLERQGRSTD